MMKGKPLFLIFLTALVSVALVVNTTASVIAQASVNSASPTNPMTAQAVATVTGDEPDIYRQAHDLLDHEVKARHLAYNQSMGCAMEWYDKRFQPQNKGAVTIDYYEPVTK